jgi:Na+/H+ antiporter NhaD/arsenite permease-like protein
VPSPVSANRLATPASARTEITLAIFVATYAVVAIGRVPGLPIRRAGAAMTGAMLMIVTGAIGPREALAAIDVRTIVVLVVMMGLIAPLQLTGVFGRVMTWTSGRVHHPGRLLAAVVVVSGVLSAVFVNDTICLAFTPVVLELADVRRDPPLPYLLALATASNIGSVATVIGNPQNILIGSVSGISPVAFTAALAPVAIAGLGLDLLLLWLLFRKQLTTHADDRRLLPSAPPRSVRGAVTPAAIVRAIDWRLLMLFIGLFVVVGAAERAGIDRRIFNLLQPIGVRTIAGLSVTAATLSNLVSNVPAVMLLTPLVRTLPHPEPAWLALAMASTLAGNLTILGSIANLIVVEGADRRGVTVSFSDYARLGIPVTLATLAFGIYWLT